MCEGFKLFIVTYLSFREGSPECGWDKWSWDENTASEASGKESFGIELLIEGFIEGGLITQHSKIYVRQNTGSEVKVEVGSEFFGNEFTKWQNLENQA